jgi:hypothetical protein
MKKEELFRVIDIAEILEIHRDAVAFRIKLLGIEPKKKWFYDKYQIELMRDYLTAPKVKYLTYESKLNYENR